MNLTRTPATARLADAQAVWYLRPLFWWQRRRYGEVLAPTRMWAHRPRALLAFQKLFRTLRKPGGPLPMELRALVSVRVSQLIGCSFCADMNGSLLLDSGASQDKLLAVSRWATEPMFSDHERLALAYTEAVTATPPTVDDALFARLKAAYSDEAIAELTAVIGFQNLSARFNTALGAEAHGFCALR